MNNRPILSFRTRERESTIGSQMERWLNRLLVICCALTLAQSTPAAARFIARCLDSAILLQ
jgi:hypothetical protein